MHTLHQLHYILDGPHNCAFYLYGFYYTQNETSYSDVFKITKLKFIL